MYTAERHPAPAASKKKKPVGTEEPAQSAVEDNTTADHGGAASPAASQSEETKTIAALLERMASLEMKVDYFEEKLTQVQSEKAALLDHQFSIVKMKDDDSAIFFFTRASQIMRH